MGFPSNLPGEGNRFQTRMSTAAVPVALGASGAFANDGNGMCTLTFTAAHGLSLTPGAGVMPNFFATFTGSSGESGGTLNSNVFKILKIPTTTTVVIYSTLTVATVTGASLIPVFFMPFTSQLSNYAGQIGPSDSTGTKQLPASLTGGAAWLNLGANAAWRYNYDNLFVGPLDSVTTPPTGTPSVAGAWQDGVSVSSKGLVYGGYQECLWANGAAGTSYVSVYS